MKVLGSHVHKEGTDLIAQYSYKHTEVSVQDDIYVCQPQEELYTFKTDTKVPKLGMMLVGWGGNNGSTITAGILANKLNLSWYSRKGEQKANYYGSITQSSTIKIGVKDNQEIYVPMKDILPLVNPDEMVIGGWDISNLDLGEAMKRAKVLEYHLID